jgi:ankyrin repeat protein
MTKTCKTCGNALSTAAFNASARAPDGLAPVCRACTNTRRRERERSAPRPARAANLAAALRRGDAELLAALRQQGLHPSRDWVFETMRSGHLALAAAVIAAGVEPDAFTMAAMADFSGLSACLDRSPDEARSTADLADSDRVTPLHVACASDFRSLGAEWTARQVRVAGLLRDHGADVHAEARYRGLDEATPLFCACWSSGNAELARWLLDQGARPADRDFMAALGHFQRHRRSAPEIADLLLASGVRVDGEPGERTPLQACAHQGNRRTVQWLIARGAAVNARGPGGRTAAHLAAERNTGPATLALLAANGADLEAVDDDGRTPLDIAELGEKTRVVQWLRARVVRRWRETRS